MEERDRAHQDMRAELKSEFYLFGWPFLRYQLYNLYLLVEQEELTSLKTEYENHVEEAKRTL